MSQSRDELATAARAQLEAADEAFTRAGTERAIARAGIADVLASLADQELRLRAAALAAAAQARTPCGTSSISHNWSAGEIVAVAGRFEAYLRTGE